MFIVPLTDRGSVACANCDSNWSMPMLAQGFSRIRMRILGFAYIEFRDGIAINMCPHCELPWLTREVPPWPMPHPFL